MKVMCINNIPTKCCNSDRVVEVPAIGDIDVVIKKDKQLGMHLYILERYGCGIGFETCHFAPLSNIDETELIKERIVPEFEQLVNDKELLMKFRQRLKDKMHCYLPEIRKHNEKRQKYVS